jgi:hypothetical protein
MIVAPVIESVSLRAFLSIFKGCSLAFDLEGEHCTTKKTLPQGEMPNAPIETIENRPKSRPAPVPGREPLLDKAEIARVPALIPLISQHGTRSRELLRCLDQRSDW